MYNILFIFVTFWWITFKCLTADVQIKCGLLSNCISCPGFCNNTGNHIPNVCFKANGQCICNPGFHGENCDLNCKSGTYGVACLQNCSCDAVECDRENGCIIQEVDDSSKPNVVFITVFVIGSVIFILLIVVTCSLKKNGKHKEGVNISQAQLLSSGSIANQSGNYSYIDIDLDNQVQTSSGIGNIYTYTEISASNLHKNSQGQMEATDHIYTEIAEDNLIESEEVCLSPSYMSPNGLTKTSLFHIPDDMNAKKIKDMTFLMCIILISIFLCQVDGSLSAVVPEICGGFHECISCPGHCNNSNDHIPNVCKHASGGCICNPGFVGADCKKPCENNSYGIACLQQCSCDPKECDKKSGCRKKEPDEAADYSIIAVVIIALVVAGVLTVVLTLLVVKRCSFKPHEKTKERTKERANIKEQIELEHFSEISEENRSRSNAVSLSPSYISPHDVTKTQVFNLPENIYSRHMVPSGVYNVLNYNGMENRQIAVDYDRVTPNGELYNKLTFTCI